MNDETLSKFRHSLKSHRDALLEWLDTESPQKEINLGGAAIKDVIDVVSEIKDTLERIEKDKFGLCQVCHEEVETERLELDFTTQICLDHLSHAQLRDLESDLELAAKVQKQLLPCCFPSVPGIQITAHTNTARIVGGDYYDFFTIKKGVHGIVLADVMGKGLPASMLMSNLQASLRILGPEYEEPDKLAIHLNELFLYNLKLIKFISIFLAKIDINNRSLQYCNAGHHPAIWREAASSAIHWLNPTGPAIGLTKNATYTSEELQFRSGDLFIFYTDGLVEARNSEDEEFGEDRLVDFVKSHHNADADVVLDKLLDAAKNFAMKFHDDMTILVIKIL